MRKNSVAALALALLSCRSCTCLASSLRRRATDRDLKKDDPKKDKSQREQSTRADGIVIVENKPCQADYQRIVDFYDKMGHPSLGSLECHADPINGCRGGCCRAASAYFVCDESGDGSPNMACVCNNFTASTITVGIGSGSDDSTETGAPTLFNDFLTEGDNESVVANPNGTSKDLPNASGTEKPKKEPSLLNPTSGPTSGHTGSPSVLEVGESTASPTESPITIILETEEPIVSPTTGPASSHTLPPTALETSDPTTSSTETTSVTPTYNKTSFVPNFLGATSARGQFKTLLKLLAITGINSTLQGSNPHTLFAPYDGAWPDAETMDSFLVQSSTTNDILKDIVSYHIVEGVIGPLDLTDGTILTTIHGKELDVSVDWTNGIVSVGGIPLRKAGLPATNGVIYEIQGLLAVIPH